MIYISFVTKNTPYENVVKEYLIPSLEKWNLKYDIDYIEDRGSWSANICYKSKFLKKMLLKHKCDIVSLDADAVIEKEPTLFETIPLEYDLGVHNLDLNAWYGRTMNQKELLGGTLFLRYNGKILSMLLEWIELQKTAKQWPQKVLSGILKKEDNQIKIYELPIEYCYIKTLPGGRKPFVDADPVISHHQVSRQYKHWKKE